MMSSFLGRIAMRGIGYRQAKREALLYGSSEGMYFNCFTRRNSAVARCLAFADHFIQIEEFLISKLRAIFQPIPGRSEPYLFLAILTRPDFVIQEHQLLWFTPEFKVISQCRRKKCSQAVIQSKHSCKVVLKPVRQTLAWCGRGEVFESSYLLITKEEG